MLISYTLEPVGSLSSEKWKEDTSYVHILKDNASCADSIFIQYFWKKRQKPVLDPEFSFQWLITVCSDDVLNSDLKHDLTHHQYHWSQIRIL